jgi:ATP-dependent DNA helicase RecG
LGESETVEFKKSTRNLRESVEAICAFANLRGGYLFFGIKDDASIIGQEVSDDTLKNLANTIQLNTEPKIYPSIERVIIQDKTCIVVTVEESPLKPHAAYGRSFSRLGSSTRRLTRDQYELLLQQRLNGYGFD